MDRNRQLARHITAVLALHAAPLLAYLGGGRWQIVDGQGVALGAAGRTPYAAWRSAAAKVKEPT